MKIKFLYTLLFPLLFSINCKAQLLDSIVWSFQQKPTSFLRLDMRNSFIAARYVKFAGVQAGLNFGNKTKVGLGFNWIIKPVTNTVELWQNSQLIQYEKRLTYYYFAPFIDYTFYKKKKWKLSIPVQLGAGWGRNVLIANNGDKIKQPSIFILTYEPAMNVSYNFLKYFEVGGSIGYRLVLSGNKTVTGNLTAPIYTVKFNVLFGKMYHNYIRT